MSLKVFILLLLPLTMSHYFKVIELQHAQFPSGVAPDPRPLKILPTYFKKIKMWHEVEGKKVYEHFSNLDPYGFRVTKSAYSADKKKHLILSGCSFTFGMGVEDEESFPYVISEKMGEYAVQNFSVRGGSSGDILYLWKHFRWNELIPQKNGIFIFVFIPDHLERMSSTWRNLNDTNRHHPLYILQDNKVEFRGVKGDHWKWVWVNFLKELKLDYLWLRGTWIFRSLELKDSELLYIKSLVELKKEYLKEFPQGRFVVTKFPSDEFGLGPESAQKFKYLAQQFGIEVWDFPYEKGSLINEGRIQKDNHPTAQAHNDFAQRLEQKILSFDKDIKTTP